MLDAALNTEFLKSVNSFQVIDLGSHKVVKLFDCCYGDRLGLFNENSLRTRIRNLREQGVDASNEERALLEMMK